MLTHIPTPYLIAFSMCSAPIVQRATEEPTTQETSTTESGIAVISTGDGDTLRVERD